jgi:hypothetical protein
MSVLLHFEEYQKARVKFVQAIAEAATRPQNIEVMNNAGVMQLLRPLLLDNVSHRDYYLILKMRRRRFSLARKVNTPGCSLNNLRTLKCDGVNLLHICLKLKAKNFS